MARGAILGSFISLIAASGCAESEDPEPTVPMGCPAVGCAAGVDIKADLPLTIEQVKAASFEICFNDTCFEKRFSESAMLPPPSRSGIGITVPELEMIDQAMSWHADLIVWRTGDADFYLELVWTPWRDSDQHDGDRLRVTAKGADEERVLIDTTVQYKLNVLDFGPDVSKACTLMCHRAELDLRASSNADD